MKTAVVLLSGGIDSYTAAMVTKSQGYDLYALSIDYGQRHVRELESARAIAEHLGCLSHYIVDTNLRLWGGSALTDNVPVPTQGVQEGAIPATYVPARNTIFLAYALSLAETVDSGVIVIGANQIDYSGYPDCRPLYLRAFEQLANLGTKRGIEGKGFVVYAPLLEMSKSDIIATGQNLGCDYSLTWSCYSEKESPCRQCDSCRLRYKGFKSLGLSDPLGE